MLPAVEGGGFFSSSASGFSKGLTLLLLGWKSEDKPMRVTPWNQYQLVYRETDPDFPLDSKQKRLVHGCASFACFGRSTSGLESPSHLKVGPAQNQELLEDPGECIGDDKSDRRIFCLKSSLKKPEDSFGVAAKGDGGWTEQHNKVYERNDDVACQMERRKVQWTDTYGGELFQIREFEMSEYGSEDEFDHGNERTCSCSIM